mmetsp:Transcript_75979/g.176265  ORF Transcript_75979/g.176265 Transcript_75979/m.176265 type:complete len:265 (-) Transcript_75979:52-846(-)
MKRALGQWRGLVPLAAPAVAAVGGVRLRAAECNSEPESEPTPSAPPLEPDHLQSGRRPPPFNPELAEEAMRSFLQSAEGRSQVQAAVSRALRGALAPEVQRGRESLQRVREGEEVGFRRHATRAAEEAAAAAAHSEVQRVHGLVQAAASAEVRREAERVVPSVIREDPRMQRVLAEHLRTVKAEVRTAVERELTEICNEERYHRVNSAFLAALERRCQDAISKTQARAEEAVHQSRRPVLLAQAVGAGALVLAVLSLAMPRSRL